jgi:arylsulfatase A-like enzyme
MSGGKNSVSAVRHGLYAILLVAAGCTLGLVAKSIMDFSRSGPQIADEIVRSYMGYAIYAMVRLGAWVFLISGFMAAAGVFAYHCLVTAFNWQYRWLLALCAAGLAVGIITFTRFAHFLLYMPGAIIASFNYRASRLHDLWEILTPNRVAMLEWTIVLLFLVPVFLALFVLVRRRAWPASAWVAGIALLPVILIGWGAAVEPPPVSQAVGAQGRPNILMIGSDTLRADRLGVNGITRPLTPHIDALAAQGANFSQHIVPLGRTAPSLLSLLTGTWPHTHGVRDNYVSDKELVLAQPALPQILREAGYRTAVVADWAGSDLGKFELGFDHIDTAPDQWNLKYLLRQGPKDIRLFLSLFTHNRFGKIFLPEIYFLAGIPLTEEVGRDSRAAIRSLAAGDRPFFLNVFIASTHGPFSSRYPYYRLYADPEYRGSSLFSMSSVSSVEEVLKAQEEGKQHFDVRQIFDLYDGAVKSFDDEVGRLMDYLRASGLDKNTIVVVYSDHGVDLFEGETWGQGNIVSDFTHRAPLVIHDPRRSPTGTVQRTVRAVDLAPTLLDLAQIPVPGFIEGQSLRPFLENGNAEPDRVAFAETGIWIARKVRGLPADRIAYPSVLDLLEIVDKQTGTLSIKPAYRDTVIRAKSRLAREGRWALVYFPLENGEQYALYDLQTDLAMRKDVMAQHPEVAERLKAKLSAWMQEDVL